ncbi:hypothetical protein F5I97DRAFT_1160775 [Phlebopus sp. FC_14]|nr:hypothetical protein F5I97DRAFT_1160775 [Phlebopus sp. FC_14]
MFQAHTDVLKSIQDQQNAILNGILPLFPLVQSVPRQIDELNLNLTNAIPNAVSNLTNSLDDIKTAFKSFESMHAQQMHTPRLATVTASRPPSKRPGSAVQDSSDIADRVDASPSPYREHRADSRSPKRSRLDAELRSAAPPQLRSQLTPKSFRPQVADVSAPILHRNPSLVSLPPGALPSPARQMALETVKRPFDDLLPASEPSKVEILGSNVRLHEECKVSQTYARDSPLPGITHREGPPASTLPALATNGRHFDTTGNSVSNPIVLGSPGPSVVDATRKSVKIEDSMQKLTGTFSITSSPLSSVPSQPQSHPPSMAQSGASAPVPREQSRLQSHEVEILTRHQPRQMHFTALSSQLSNLPVSSNPCTSTSPSKSMSLRDRRAQMSVLGRTRTRRIIPLLPSSDEEF